MNTRYALESCFEPTSVVNYPKVVMVRPRHRSATSSYSVAEKNSVKTKSSSEVSYGTVTLTAVVACPMYLSFATTAMRCLPEVRLNFFASWSPHFMYCFLPSIDTCNWLTPAGELPEAFTNSGEVTVAPFEIPQILPAIFAEFGGGQFFQPPV